MAYQEFLNDIQKKGSKPHHIGHCLGARDAWKWVRKNKWKLLKGHKFCPQLYGALIGRVNTLLIEKLLEGHQIVLPHLMGSLELVGTPAKLKEEKGKLKTNYRVDWKKTLECWYNDEEARNERIKVKRIQKYLYSIKYSKSTSNYRNQKFYNLRLNRSLVRTLGKKIENEKLNALIY